MRAPRLLVGCESSGKVREAFRRRGFDAWSCDLLPADDASPYHYQADLRLVVGLGWDALIAHPPCTYLCSSGLHWNKRVPGRDALTEEALDFVRWLMALPIPHKAIENPIGCISSRIRKPDQIIQPWMFGDDASKATCLWLEGLPTLVPTNVVEGRVVNGRRRWANQTDSGQNKLPPSADRWKLRSETYDGIADAMADQWSTWIDAHLIGVQGIVYGT
jgi:hypothetical protein